MIKSFTKKTLFTIIACCFAFIAKAQLGFNYSQYDIGVSAGLNQVYGDAETITSTPSINFNLTYNVTPYVNFVFETQLGRLSGGDSLKTRSGREFNNDFAAFIFRGQLQLGELFDYSKVPLFNAVKNFYVSAGVGYVFNNITAISRHSYIVPSYNSPGMNKSKEPFIPIRVGYEFKLFNSYQQPSVKIEIAYNYNIILGDELDGYKTGNSNDAYSQISLGVKFALGDGIISYRKRIPY